ncbi:MAG: endonuclease V [Candidatus Aminicenantes bacterium]|nr:endonuclease V [Candidatus Aminicenantes bacterium]MDH5384143.1 endonuclease V [Candidatus Aminicenantes bacterium]MDH5742985.1 endonuclease V [Candidatus Aminicenantes bacterium]
MFDLKKAARIQHMLSSRLVLTPATKKVRSLAGADFSYHREKALIGAVVAVLKIPEFELMEVVGEVREVSIPYIPGYLNFREGPAFIKAFRRLKNNPDVTLIDGNGIAHPRRMGLASYVGVLLDIPTIGCAKSPFFPFRSPSEQRGAFSIYRDQRGEKVGYCLRTRSSVKPIFVSPGHRMDFDFSLEIVLHCSRYRIPEPLRVAHRLAKDLFSETDR